MVSDGMQLHLFSEGCSSLAGVTLPPSDGVFVSVMAMPFVQPRLCAVLQATPMSVDDLEKKEEELFRTGPLSVLTTSVKTNSQVSDELRGQGVADPSHCLVTVHVSHPYKSNMHIYHVFKHGQRGLSLSRPDTPTRPSAPAGLDQLQK